MTFAHGGNIGLLARRAGLAPDQILDFSASLNPLGPPERLRSFVNRALGDVIHYPDPYSGELAAAIAARHGLTPEQVVVGNGSTEILYALPRALGVRRAVIPTPSYADYRAGARLAQLNVEEIVLDPASGFALPWEAIAAALRGDEMVVLGQPNNPTGLLFDNQRLMALAARHPATWFVVDEAFADFVEGYRSLIHAGCSNIVVVRSMTKFYAIPGLRLGYALAGAEFCRTLRQFIPPWSVGTLAQSVGTGVLADQTYRQATLRTVERLKQNLADELGRLPGLTVCPGSANFLLARLAGPLDAVQLEEKLLERGIAIRVCANFPGLDQSYFRVAVRTETENQRLLEALSAVLQPAVSRAGAIRGRKPAFMLLGTTSSAGKSVLTTALCRILLQDGYRVAPFKAQNMSRNSFVTAAGGEMSCAQAIQARACELAPDVRMNPVLLKPHSDVGAQVIVMGAAVGRMTVEEYIAFKPRLFDTVRQAYDALATEVDVMVIEGAGSPAEVNLKAHDIVNLAMAEHAGAVALLAGDIDRGGVFAAFAGTLDLLSERERRLIAGFLINRFRGRAELLHSAIEIVQNYTGLPTFGVVPYISALGLPEEDSLGAEVDQNQGTVAVSGSLGENAALERLAAIVREHIDLKALYRKAGLR